MPDTAELTPREFVEATDALAVSLRLLLLDKVWTQEAQLASTSATRDPERVGELGAVVDEMDNLLLECKKVAPQLAAIAGRKGALLQSRFDGLADDASAQGVSGERMSEVVRRLRHHVDEKADGSAASYLGQAADLLSERADTEIKEIRAEHERILAGGVSNGDMDEDTQQAVGAIAMGAGLLLGPEAAGVVLVVAGVIDCLTS
jgi:hypothetical protein